MGWWLLRLTLKILDFLRLTFNLIYFHYGLQKLKTTFHYFLKLKINFHY